MAMDFRLGGIGEKTVVIACGHGMVIDVKAGLLQGHTLHVKEDPDALGQRQELAEFQPCSQLRLTTEDEKVSLLWKSLQTGIDSDPPP